MTVTWLAYFIRKLSHVSAVTKTLSNAEIDYIFCYALRPWKPILIEVSRMVLYHDPQ